MTDTMMLISPSGHGLGKVSTSIKALIDCTTVPLVAGIAGGCAEDEGRVTGALVAGIVAGFTEVEARVTGTSAFAGMALVAVGCADSESEEKVTGTSGSWANISIMSGKLLDREDLPVVFERVHVNELFAGKSALHGTMHCQKHVLWDTRRLAIRPWIPASMARAIAKTEIRTTRDAMPRIVERAHKNVNERLCRGAWKVLWGIEVAMEPAPGPGRNSGQGRAA